MLFRKFLRFKNTLMCGSCDVCSVDGRTFEPQCLMMLDKWAERGCVVLLTTVLSHTQRPYCLTLFYRHRTSWANKQWKCSLVFGIFEK